MNQNIVFYITNHGYGHASRNVAIIKDILDKNNAARIWIKTDSERAAFLKRNFQENQDRIDFDENYNDVGFPLKEKTLEVDTERLYQEVCSELAKWPDYIAKEIQFLKAEKIDIVVSDVIPWVLPAAKEAGVYSVLLCNFTWYEMYRDYLPQELCRQYYDAYNSADKIFLYAMGNPEIEHYYKNVERVSLVSRQSDPKEVQRISEKYTHPIVFVSVGKSITLNDVYDVSYINATFITTVGVNMHGKNVVQLPADTINTQDYIAAGDYIISKTGWSTLAEIFLNNKPVAAIARGNNPEDNAVLKLIHDYGCGITCTFEDLRHLNRILELLGQLDSSVISKFHDDCAKLAEYILYLQ